LLVVGCWLFVVSLLKGGHFVQYNFMSARKTARLLTE